MANIKATSQNDINSIRRTLHRNPDLAVLGQTSDASSPVFVNERPGYWYVRPVQAGGGFGPPEIVRGCTIPMATTPGTPVKLGLIEGEKAVLGPDFVGMLTQGVNPTQAAVVDPNANNPSFVNQAMITTAFGQIVEDTLKVAIRGVLVLASGTWAKFEGVADFTGNVPTSGNHRLAVIALKNDYATLEIQYSTAKSDLVPLDLSDVQEAWTAMSAPTTNAPLWGFSLADAQTELTEANRWADLRQLINIVGAGAAGSITSLSAGTGITLTPNPIVTTGTIALANTAVSPGSYTNASLTVDQQGRLTAASSGAAPVTSVSASSPLASSGGATPNISLSGIVSTAHGGTGVDLSASGSATAFLAEDASHVISARSIIAADIPNLDASKITTGALALARGGTNADLSASGSATAFLAQDGSHVVSARSIIAADVPNLDASKITTGQLVLARGGTGADLSATGGANQFVKQSSSGAVFTVGAILSADLTSALTTPPAIGGSTPSTGAFTTLSAAATTITGTSDTQQLTIVGNATQTSVLQRWRNSTPTTVASVDNLGHARFGSSTAPGANTVIDSTKTFADPAAATIGMNGQINITLTATNAQTIFGFRAAVGIDQTGFNYTGVAAGLNVLGQASGSSNTISTLYAGRFAANNAGAGTVTNLYGVYILRPTNSGTITNNYGLYVESQNRGATLNYAIFTNVGLVSLGDQLLVTGSQDIVQEIIKANGTQTNDIFEAQDSSANVLVSIQKNGALSGSMDTMTYAATISLDITKGNLHKTTTVNATGNSTINASAAGTAGQHLWILIINDATSGKVITFGTNFKPNGTLTGTVSKGAIVHFVSDGINFYEVARTLVL